MFIRRKLATNKQWGRFFFPYRIGIVEPGDKLRRLWRPGSSTRLTGDLPPEHDPFGTVDKLGQLGSLLNCSGAGIERVDVAHDTCDSLDIKIDQRNEVVLLEHWIRIDQYTSEVFCLEVR